MSIIIGSARADENYKYSGGRRGDQRQKSSYDTSGEVSLQNFYEHKKGWYILRPKNVQYANGIAKAMYDACNNKHFGYSQSDRLSVFNYKSVKNADIKNDVNCDCSSLVRKCILDGTGKDVGSFSTLDEPNVLERSGLFEKKKRYKPGMKLYTGDIIVTISQGHTAVVTKGDKREGSNDKSGDVKSISYTIGKKYTVKVSTLNMRNKPSVTTGNIITTLCKGDKMTCKQVKKSGSSVWINNGAGWACAISSNGEVYIG